MKLFFKNCFLFIILICFSCEDIESNRRFVFSGNLIDENNQPIENAQITSTLRVQSIGTDASNPIGRGQTDPNGDFEFVSLVPLSSRVGLSINANQNTNNQEFAEVSFSIENSVFDNKNAITLEDFKLPRKANLDVNIEKTSTQPAFLEWSIEFIRAECFIEIDENSVFDNLSFCNTLSSISGQNTSQNPNNTANIESLRNAIAIFIYSINNEPNQVIEISLNNPSNDFQFTY